jgi:hypothetical protein
MDHREAVEKRFLYDFIHQNEVATHKLYMCQSSPLGLNRLVKYLVGKVRDTGHISL